LLGDNQRDREMQRNHTIAIVLMTVLVIVWFYLFAPTPPPPSAYPQEHQAAAPAPETPDSVSAIEKQMQAVRASATAEVADPAAAAASIASLAYDPDAAPANEFTLSNDRLELVFTDIGARLKQSTVLVTYGPPQPLIPVDGAAREDEVDYPMGLRFQNRYLGDLLDRLRWEHLPAPDATSLTFAINLPEPFHARIVKTFTLAPEQPNVLRVAVEFTNTGGASRLLGLDMAEPAYSLIWSPNVASGDEANLMAHQELVWRENGANIHFPTSKLAPVADGSYAKVMPAPEWVAIKSAYFVVAMMAEFDGVRGWAQGQPGDFEVALDVPRAEVAPGETDNRTFLVYLGPAEGASLAEAWPGLKSVLQFFTWFGFMDTFAKALLFVLNWFYGSILANYGFAIIFLTVLVRTAMYPLTLKGMKSMKKMQKLAPLMEEIKKEVGDDQQEMQKRMMELYRERGVNPLGGCMPMLLQMPVFFAMYRVFATAFEFRGAPFVGWISDLSEPDALFALPFVIPVPFTANGVDSFNLLPILMGLAMVASFKLMPTSGPAQNPQQKMIMTLMPVIFSVICYNMASGLNLYILTSTLLGIVQNYFIHVSDEELGPKPGKTGKTGKAGKAKPGKKARPKHFYAAAQARKREMAKEQRREKKKGRPGKGRD